jgi:RHS repeat-associated protein
MKNRNGKIQVIIYSEVINTMEQNRVRNRYEYDAFGKPYQGDLTTGMNLGYTGKPYDTATGLYNYGYRDYQPEAARFTTVDPIRDGANWFTYVNNDPVNWVDPWGLSASDKQNSGNLFQVGKGMSEQDKFTNQMSPSIPISPPGVDIDANIEKAKGMSANEFYEAVRNGGEWDYKQQGSKHQDFGNFNYGATGKAVGFPDFVLERAAGWAQEQAGTSKPEWGHWYGSAPYGDDPDDQK